MDSSNFISDLGSSAIDYVSKEFLKKKNKERVRKILDKLSDSVYIYIKPFLYTIILILVLMFVMNCLQFYVYFKTLRRTNFPSGPSSM